MDCSLPGSSVHGIFQARILEWVAIPLSRASSQPSDQTQVSYIASGFFTVWATFGGKLRNTVIQGEAAPGCQYLLLTSKDSRLTENTSY